MSIPKNVTAWKVEFVVSLIGDDSAELTGFTYQVQTANGKDATEAFKEWLETKLYAGCASVPLSLQEDGIVTCKVIWKVDVVNGGTSTVDIENVTKLSRHLEEGLPSKERRESTADRINDWIYECTKEAA